MLISNDWYPALDRDDVDLVTDRIEKITPRGIVTADGTEREIDVLVVATGFLATDLPIARHIHGRDGRHAWPTHFAEHGMQAYKGATVHGFPNLFFVVGPNTGLGHSSMVFMIESQVAYARRRAAHDAAAGRRRRRADRAGAAGLERRPAAPDAAHRLEHRRLLELVPRRARPQRRRSGPGRRTRSGG